MATGLGYTTGNSDWRFETGTACGPYHWVSEPRNGANAVWNINIQVEEVREMRGLFHVILVNYKTEDIWDRFIVADNAEKAKIKGLLCYGEDNPDMEVDDLDIICNKLGDVRKKKEVQKVTLVKDGDG